MLHGEMQCHFMKLPESPCLQVRTGVPPAPGKPSSVLLLFRRQGTSQFKFRVRHIVITGKQFRFHDDFIILLRKKFRKDKGRTPDIAFLPDGAEEGGGGQADDFFQLPGVFFVASTSTYRNCSVPALRWKERRPASAPSRNSLRLMSSNMRVMRIL